MKSENKFTSEQLEYLKAYDISVEKFMKDFKEIGRLTFEEAFLENAQIPLPSEVIAKICLEFFNTYCESLTKRNQKGSAGRSAYDMKNLKKYKKVKEQWLYKGHIVNVVHVGPNQYTIEVPDTNIDSIAIDTGTSFEDALMKAIDLLESSEKEFGDKE